MRLDAASVLVTIDERLASTTCKRLRHQVQQLPLNCMPTYLESEVDYTSNIVEFSDRSTLRQVTGSFSHRYDKKSIQPIDVGFRVLCVLRSGCQLHGAEKAIPEIATKVLKSNLKMSEPGSCWPPPEQRTGRHVFKPCE